MTCVNFYAFVCLTHLCTYVLVFRKLMNNRQKGVKCLGLGKLIFWLFTLSAMGGGGSNWPAFLLASLTAKRPNERGWKFLIFFIYMLNKNWTKIFWLFFGGTPNLAPQRRVWPKNGHPWLPMTPTFYYSIFFYYKKNLKIWRKKIFWMITDRHFKQYKD